MKREIRFAGFGGQGIITAAIILGRAAAIHDNKYAIQTQSYGPEARGGASKSEVIISDEEIFYPKVSKLEIMVVLSPQALDKYKKDLMEGGILIYDSVLIRKIPEGYTTYGIPALTMANDDLGNKIVANILMLGAFVAITKVVEKDALKKAVLESVPKWAMELNEKAFEMGYDYALNLIGEK